MTKRYKWIVEFSVDASWVADGFNLSAERAKEMLAHNLRGAFGHEIGARILAAPQSRDIAKEQGFSSVKAMRAAG